MYLTPESLPAATRCRQLVIPDDPYIVAAVNGALSELAEAYNWQAFGAVTPDEMAGAMAEMYYGYLSEECGSKRVIGEIVCLAGSTLPEGMLWCDGAEYEEAAYPALFTEIGAVYGGGAGWFRVPDLRGRTIVGAGFGPGLSNRVIGDKGGAEAHVLSIAEMPAHSHGLRYTQRNSASGSTTYTIPSGGTGYNSGSAGAGDAHNNMQPFTVLQYAIVAQV